MVWHRNRKAGVPVLNMPVHCGSGSPDGSCRPLVVLPHILDWALFYNHLKAGVLPVLVHCIIDLFFKCMESPRQEWNGVESTGKKWSSLEFTGQERSAVESTGVELSGEYRPGMEYAGQKWSFQFSQNVLGYSTLITASFCSSDL